MKAVIILAFLAFIGLSSAQIITRFVDLRVDHFNPLDRRTFDDRYFSNSEHFLPGGPIFIYVSSGFEVYDEFLARGAVFEIARDTRGHLFALERRYFGTSRPTEDASVQNLRWLTIDQTIADIAEFIAFIKSNYYGAANSRVILWGRGAGGAIAVWARQKYPNAVDGVWASSAPINAIMEFPQLLSNTFTTINNIGGPECGNILNGAFRIIEDGIRLRNTSRIENRLQLCSPVDLDIEEDVARLYYGIAAEVAYSFVANARYPDIDDKCTIMRGFNTPQDLPEDDFEAFARWYIDDFNRNLECLNFNNTAVVAQYQNIQWDTVSTIAGRRQSFWLQCTQTGQFPIANEGENHPFGWRFTADFFRQWCAQAFDEEIFTQDFIENSIARTNNLYGGLSPAVYRVFFTHGEMDPRRNLGPNEDLNAYSPAVVMSLQSFARDLGSPSEADYAVLVETKERARDLILQWIVDAGQEQPTQPPPPGETTTVDPVPAKY